MKELRTAICLFVSLSILTGAVYPAFVTLFGWTFMHAQASGSVLERDGVAIGSSLIGQPFQGDRYFQGRPSATSPHPYNGAASSGANQAPSNPALRAAAVERVHALRAANASREGALPVDLVAASASGLDPHVSPAAAEFQVPRVARARGIDEAAVRGLVEAATSPRTLGVLGEPRVNVLQLNLALDGIPSR
jgi:potassium-transporting ATPase KdpC subunit